MDDRAWAIRYMEVGTRNWCRARRYWFLRRGFRASVGSTPKSTLAFRERRSRPGRVRRIPPISASMKTDSTPLRPSALGCMKTNQSLRLHGRRLSHGVGHPETRMPAMFSAAQILFDIALELEATLKQYRTPAPLGESHHGHIPYWKRAHHDWRFWIGMVLAARGMGLCRSNTRALEP